MGPPQAMKPAIRALAAEARTAAGMDLREETVDLQMIDMKATSAGRKKRTKDENKKLSICQGGGAWCNATLYHTGRVQSQKCDFCLCERQTIAHLVWQCPRFNEVRN